MAHKQLALIGEDPEIAEAGEAMVVRGVSPREILDVSDTTELELATPAGAKCDYLRDSALNPRAKQPLPKPEHEAFVRDIVAGVAQFVAYQRNISNTASRKTATQQASRMVRRADVQARLRWLCSAEGRAAMAMGGEEAPQGKPGEPMTRQEKLGQLEAIIRGGNPSDRVRAIQEHNRILREDAGGRIKRLPDPVALMEYLRIAEEQGKDPLSLAQELTAKGVGVVASEAEEKPPEETPESEGNVA